MKKVNLKDLYYYIQNDIEVEVDDDIYELIILLKRKEHAYREKIRRNKAYYSLDRNDGIENEAIKKVKSPEEIFNEKNEQIELLDLIRKLPEKQAERIIAYFYYDLSVGEIARIQGVHQTTVSESILLGIKNLKKLISNPFK